MATSKLQRLVGETLDKSFPELTILENYRPDWLISSNYTKLELDFYIVELKIAFEIQGEQHTRFIEFFHRDIKGWEKSQRYDKEKKDLCFGMGIKLIEIYSSMDLIIQLGEIDTDNPVFEKFKEKHNKSVELTCSNDVYSNIVPTSGYYKNLVNYYPQKIEEKRKKYGKDKPTYLWRKISLSRYRQKKELLLDFKCEISEERKRAICEKLQTAQSYEDVSNAFE